MRPPILVDYEFGNYVVILGFFSSRFSKKRKPPQIYMKVWGSVHGKQNIAENLTPYKQPLLAAQAAGC